MSTPTDQFANLSIESDEISMARTEEDQNERTFEARDVISSFDTHMLPNECEPIVYANITTQRQASLRLQQTHWTIQGNLAGTLLQWCAHDPGFCSNLCRIQNQDDLAMLFSEKITRRFDECLKEYDVLPSSATPEAVREKVHEMAASLHVLSTAIYERRQYRDTREFHILRVALNGLKAVCERKEPILPAARTYSTRQSSRRTGSLGDAELSLFAAVIRQPRSSSGLADKPFMLGALELFSGKALKACLEELVSINGLLNKYRAGDGYIQRFEDLQHKANNESADQPGPSGSKRGNTRSDELEADPRPGSKRPQHQPTEGTPKRGRRGGSS